MANWFSRLVSKATFWDQEDDKRVAREDEEERRRKNMLAVSSSSVNRPSVNFQQNNSNQFDFNQPLMRIGSQGSSNPLLKDQEEKKNPLIASQSQSMLKKPPVEEKSDAQKELDRLAAENLDQARKDATQGQNWFQKTFLNGKNNEERAIAQARNRASSQYQDKHGWNADPEVLKYNQGTTGRLSKESTRVRKQGERLDNFAKGMDKVGEVAQYVPITGSVLNLGLAGTERLAKATGNDQLAADMGDQRLRLDVGMNQEEFNQLDPETQQKLRNLQNLGLALSPLDFLGVGGLAKSGVMGVGKKATTQLIRDGAVDATTRAALRKAAAQTGKSAVLPSIVGAGASVGAQAYLGGAENIDAVEAGKTGLLVGGTSMLFPSQGIRRAGKQSVDNAVGRSIEEAPGISKLKKATDAAEEAEDAVEVVDGLKSNNRAKTNPDGIEVATPQRAENTPTPQRTPDSETEAQLPPQSETAPRIPDVTNPRVLAKATDDIPTVDQEIPIADFSEAIDASTPLQRAPEPAPVAPQIEPTPTDIAEQAARGELRMSTRTDAEMDAQGNPTLMSDADAVRELTDVGIAPQRGGSAVESVEGAMETAAQRAARDEVALAGAAAPRTRARITARIDDDQLRADLNSDVPALDRTSLPEAEANAKAYVNDMSDEGLVARFSDAVQVNDPQGFYTALNSIRRLEQIDAPEARDAIRNALDAMTDYASRSGRGLRTTQVVFEDMPTTMKAEYLINKIQKAGSEMDDTSRAELLRRIQASDDAADSLRALETEAQQILDSGVINNRSLDPEIEARAGELSGQIREASRLKELAQGDAWRFYQESLPNSSVGKRAGDMGRTLMLSAPSGRMFDVLSTGATTTDDILTRSVGDAIGGVVNRVRGAGTVTDSGFNPGQFLGGMAEGARDIANSFRGRGRVESILNEASRASRGDIQTGGGRIRNTIRSMVEMPTNLTRGLRNDELYRQAAQEAAQIGLKGDAQDVYARLRSAVPSEDQLRQAEQSWKKANMLHDNAISRALNNVANSLDKKGGGWASPIIRNQIAPFTSWLGGNLHRTLTDKNLLHNAYKIVDGAFVKKDPQMVVDNIAKAAVNVGEAYALGYLLTEAGVVTTSDANGDSYGGLYFHIGDRYIPVAVAGTMAVPIILGNSAHQGVEEGGDFATMVNEGGMNLLKNAGVSSVFGGENNLQRSIAEASREGGDLLNAAAQFTGGVVRQYIPGLSADINSFIDQTGLNPTGEAAETRVTEENPETGRERTNVFATEVNKTLNRLPFASQALDRKEGVLADDPLDRILKGSRESSEAAQQREVSESLADIEKQLRADKVPLKSDDINDALDDGDFENAIRGLEYNLAKTEADPNATERSKERARDNLDRAVLRSEGVPLTEEGVRARRESGNYDQALRGLEYKLTKIENDDDVPASKKRELRQEIGRMQVYRDGEYAPNIVQAYESSTSDDGGIGVTAWRDMMESGDPSVVEAAEKLAELDQKLLKAGLIKTAKYYWKGGRSGGRGRGGSGKAGGFTTNIALQRFRAGGGFTPQKELAASFAAPQTAIPTLQRVPNNDTSMKKKITVTKGGRS